MSTADLFASGGIVRTEDGRYFDMRRMSTAEIADMVVAMAAEISRRVGDTGNVELQSARAEAALILADTASDLAIFEARAERGERLQ